ncbi:MAG: hypothetical protein Q8M95_06390 [Candidatus Methanoperedens sp.]|nr:hypothetical protein [Candidatus Methanoperedens sp.]
MVYIKATLNKKVNHLYGKTKRLATSIILPIDENRNGNCSNCGACCKFLFKCPFLIPDANGSNVAICAIYEMRPPQCRKYPRAKDEQVHEPCGYCFTDAFSR